MPNSIQTGLLRDTRIEHLLPPIGYLLAAAAMIVQGALSIPGGATDNQSIALLLVTSLGLAIVAWTDQAAHGSAHRRLGTLASVTLALSAILLMAGLGRVDGLLFLFPIVVALQVTLLVMFEHGTLALTRVTLLATAAAVVTYWMFVGYLSTYSDMHPLWPMTAIPAGVAAVTLVATGWMKFRS